MQNVGDSFLSDGALLCLIGAGQRRGARLLPCNIQIRFDCQWCLQQMGSYFRKRERKKSFDRKIWWRQRGAWSMGFTSHPSPVKKREREKPAELYIPSYRHKSPGHQERWNETVPPSVTRHTSFCVRVVKWEGAKEIFFFPFHIADRHTRITSSSSIRDR